MTTTVKEDDRLATLAAVVTYYLKAPSTRIAAVATLAAIALRTQLGAPSWGDLLVLLVLLVLVGPFEWVVHRFALHADPQSLRSKWFNSSEAHLDHHAAPNDLSRVMLLPGYTLAFLPSLFVIVAAWAVPLLLLTGQPLAPGLVTATAAAWAGLAHYEWAHLLAHSLYRPRLRYYVRLGRNHRRHHHVDDRRWMGVTSSLGDRLFGTL